MGVYICTVLKKIVTPTPLFHLILFLVSIFSTNDANKYLSREDMHIFLLFSFIFRSLESVNLCVCYIYDVVTAGSKCVFHV